MKMLNAYAVKTVVDVRGDRRLWR